MIPEEDELELDEKSGGKGSSLATLSRVSEIPFVPFSVSAGFDVGADKVKEVVRARTHVGGPIAQLMAAFASASVGRRSRIGTFVAGHGERA